MNTIIEKIRAEVNRLKPRIRKICGEEVKIPVEKVREKFDTLLSFLSGLEKECEEKPTTAEGLEEEIERYLHSLGVGYGGWVDGMEDDDLRGIARHFAQWQKEQMMKGAVEWDYTLEDGRIEFEGDPLPCLNPILNLQFPKFKPGQKVKLIIVKED